MKIILFIAYITSINFTWQDDVDNSSIVTADGGYLKLHTFYKVLNQFEIEVIDGVNQRHSNWELNVFTIPIKNTGGLELVAPYGGLKAVTKGQLHLDAQFTWRLPEGKVIEFKNLVIRPSKQPLKSGDLTVLEVVNDTGDVVFIMDHIHAGFNQLKTQLFLENMDVRMSTWLANKMNIPELENHIAGQAHLYSNLVIPSTYVAKDYPMGTCVAGDNWPPSNPDVDVALIEIEEAESFGDVGADHVIFTPSATLENVGTADVAWYRKFFGSYPPYNNDQHPYLIWNMYREIDGRFEQIGVSGVKHAFFTTNTVCNCEGGQILFPSCSDKYSVTNNHSPSHIGPRDDLDSVFLGLWESTNSFFDQDGNGVQDNSSNGVGENRMVVAKSDFTNNALPYYISSWYVIRDDINIFNNMGYKQFGITPSSNPNHNGWLLSSTTPFANGSASDQYVSPDTFDLNAGTASQRLLQAGEGHLTVAVKVIDLGGGQYRYNYMVENHDYDPQVQTIILPLIDLASFSNFVFADTDEDTGNDWTVTHTNDTLTIQAPAGNEIDWGILYSFSFTTNSVPQAGDVTLTGLENTGTQFSSSVITPYYDDLIFATGFENLN